MNPDQTSTYEKEQRTKKHDLGKGGGGGGGRVEIIF